MNNENMKRSIQLSDADMEMVSGGFSNNSGYSSGNEIMCHSCGETDEGNFEVWNVAGDERDHFRCHTCGHTFTVDSNGVYGTP